ncbi:MAG TPA: right-handed parallel beta-helix repeat-containing protein [Chitinophagaceae bacterium]|nr:right-handed parallel beta-helix repeat-containing protein [Chitinophagaceae bacterium]
MGRMILLVTWLISFSRYTLWAQQTYYLSPRGSDRQDGRSPRHPWKTILKLNHTHFLPGDRILLAGGAVFPGTIILQHSAPGMSIDPLILGSYGKGKATIDGGNGDAIYAGNFSGLEITRLVLRGSGIHTNRGSGIECYGDDTTARIADIRIAHCSISGFRHYGIVIWSAASAAVKGFREIRITHCEARDNGLAGIASFSGNQRRYVHRDFRISWCSADHNPGIASLTSTHSGDGIVMGSVDSLIISHCEAYDNGRYNACNAGGPVGIWVWLCRHALIQHCLSYDNHTGSLKDGGGFDIDGGSSDCLMQYNYSHDNDGAGYLLAEYGALLPYRDNIVRFNISLNDGRKNGYGGITIWGASPAYQVTESYIYNNLILAGSSSGSTDTPSDVRLLGDHFREVVLTDNVFLARGRGFLLCSNHTPDTGKIRLMSNDYFHSGSPGCIRWGKDSCLGWKDWVRIARGQEMVQGRLVGFQADPQISWPESRKAVMGFRSLRSPQVPFLNKGVRPDLPPGLLPAALDYYGRRIPQRSPYFIGISAR